MSRKVPDDSAKEALRGLKKKFVPQPIIFDTDYGEFIDDVFALGLIVNSGDLLDLKYVMTTSEDPEQSAKCVARHLDLAKASGIGIGQGSPYPDVSLRAGVCFDNGFTRLGMPLADTCNDGPDLPFDANGLETMAAMLQASDRDDWWYMVVGGQTTLKDLIEQYPAAAAKISTLIVMGGNWCANFQPYPDVDAPTDETNISCDPVAANIVSSSTSPFDKIYYVPVVVADEIGGEDYIKFVSAAQSGADAGAMATLEFYKAWSAAARADPSLLIHKEAMTYDPLFESTPQFDACAVMLALQLLDHKKCDDRMKLYDLEDGVHFLETTDSGLQPYPQSPRGGFSLLPEGFMIADLPEQCPALTEFTFNPATTPEAPKPVNVALVFERPQAKDILYAEMAARMAGTYPGKKDKCYNPKTKKTKAPKASKGPKASKAPKASKEPKASKAPKGRRERII